MKMIRFENVCDSIREAMFRFYMEQTCFDRDVCVEKIEKLVDRTFDAMSEIPNTNLTVGNIPRFAVYKKQRYALYRSCTACFICNGWVFFG